MALPTQNELLERFKYNPDTGCLSIDDKESGYTTTNGYRLLCIKKQRIYAHRAIWCMMTGDWPKHEIDHINGIKSDNRWLNLRAATRHQNALNQKRTKKNTSGYKGVSFHTRVGRWRAVIKINNKHKHLGYFDSPEAAFLVYRKVAEENFGEFANIT